MPPKREFDLGAFIGQYFSTGGACMITEFVIEKYGLLNACPTVA